MYCPGKIDYPNEPLCLGKYLEHALHEGLAMTAKMLQYNGDAVYHSVEEQADLSIEQDIITFRETAEKHLGAKLT